MIVIAYISINMQFKINLWCYKSQQRFPAAGRGELLGEYMEEFPGAGNTGPDW